MPNAGAHRDTSVLTSLTRDGSAAFGSEKKAKADITAPKASATADVKDTGFLSKIPIFGPLLGFFASVFTLYSYSAFRKRHAENLEMQAKEQAALSADVQYVAEDKVAGFSGLKGKALIAGKKYPTKPEVMAAIPKELMKRDTFKSMMYALMSLTVTGLCVFAGTFIPYSWTYAWAWAIYGVVTGTVATGCWVVAHECGHNAFSDNRVLQDAVGYTFHSLLLVPYFSWQRSHAVHHANTNNMETGETHVPRRPTKHTAGISVFFKKALGPLWPLVHSFVVLAFGWPMYLISGESGGPAYGKTNHFWPYAPFNNGKKELFPGKHKLRVLLSDIGVLAVIAGLIAWGTTYGAMYPVLHYVLPYMFTNAWLVGYTWLQHTDVDVPHFDQNQYTWAKGAFHTIDRPYGPVLDFLHHGIGSTHVCHHVNSAIPHYNAWKVTEHLKTTFPDIYLYDPTPIHKALWRVANNCIAVDKQPGEDGMYVWLKEPLAALKEPKKEEEKQPIAQQPVLATV
jgi:omega-6 fatty acid desaturase (delta-12 desaturase)